MTLRPGQPAPDLTFPLVGGARWDLRRASAAHDWIVIEVYRGRHCGVCEAHLRALAPMLSDFTRYDAALVAVSMDTRDRAEDAARAWDLGDLEVGYGLDEPTARAWGLYLSDRYRDGEPTRFAEPATFVVRRDGSLYAADVRSSPHLRPQLDRLLTLVRRASEGYPPRGTA